MRYLLVSAAIAVSALAPSAALAQSTPAAIIVVVDSNRAANDCNACKTAAASLRSQAQAFETRRTTLTNQLAPERKSIQTAVDALGNKEPDAALQARIKAFQTKAQAAEQELATTQQRLQSINVNILKQIKEKLDPAVQAVMTRRGANLAVEVDNTLAHSQALDVTNEVIAQLNSTLASVSATPLPQAATPPASR
jgi:Skp family chaperone for outer membrane proteins